MKTEIQTLAQRLGQALLERNWRVTCAESCTGGGVAHAITDIAGSSQWFDAGFVTYSNAMKQRMLGVPADVLEREGAVSETVVRDMAQGAVEAACADLAVAISGIAGPDGGSSDKPVGTVWFGWQCSDGRSVAKQCHFSGDRSGIREQAVHQALEGLLSLAITRDK